MEHCYDLKMSTVEIRNPDWIREGCTLEGRDAVSSLAGSFADREEALEALKARRSVVLRLSGAAGSFYSVTEFYVEENVYDSDGEWMSGGDVWAFSEMPEGPWKGAVS